MDPAPLDGDEEEDRFSRILRRDPGTNLEVDPTDLEVDPEELRQSMLCNYLPILFSCKRKSGLRFYRVVRGGARANEEEGEVRFHRILRENRDSEPSGFQDTVWEDLDSENDETGLDSEIFQRSLRQKEQRATEGGWGPMGKRSLKVS